MTQQENDHDLLVTMAAQVEAVHKVVMGNGRPGLLHEVTTMRAEIDAIQHDIPTKWEKIGAKGSAGTLLVMGAGILAKLLGVNIPL